MIKKTLNPSWQVAKKREKNVKTFGTITPLEPEERTKTIHIAKKRLGNPLLNQLKMQRYIFRKRKR